MPRKKHKPRNRPAKAGRGRDLYVVHFAYRAAGGRKWKVSTRDQAAVSANDAMVRLHYYFAEEARKPGAGQKTVVLEAHRTEG